MFSIKNKTIITGSVMLLFAVVILTGCKKDDEPLASSSFPGSASEDAAESISASLGNDNGGAADNLTDVVQLGSGLTFSTLSLGKSENSESVDSSYNTSTGEWTVTLSRERGSLLGYPHMSVHRVYQFTFYRDLNDSTSFQKYRTVNGTIASAMKFKIVSGSGTFETRRMDHKLLSVTGSYIITNLNTDTLIINSDENFVRTGSDTITTRNVVRTLNHTTTLHFSNIKAPRFRPLAPRQTFFQAFSGTISGTIKGTVTVQKGELYKDRTIDKTFTVTISDGTGTISIDGKGFTCNIQTGEREDSQSH
ncbi:MAG: hypothetical protein H3C35_02055 [Bacteroidetes bacterium]|nr:hypothetical protein [Bacteroidota bacterium]